MRLLNLGIAAILAVYALTGTFARYEADDYCQAVDALEYGAIGFTVDQYQTWQGRYTSTFVMGVLHTTLGSRAPAIVPAVLILSMVGGWYYALRPVRREYALTLALVMTLGIISGVPNIWQGLYWMPAALTYLLPLPIALLLGGWLLRRVRSSAGSSLPVSANNGA